MLDDKDSFQKTSMYAELLLEEAKGLAQTLLSPTLDKRLAWCLFLRNFLIKHAAEIDEAMNAEAGR